MREVVLCFLAKIKTRLSALLYQSPSIVCITFLPDFERNSVRFPSEEHVFTVALRTLDVGRLSILTSSFDKGASQIEGFSLMHVGNSVQIPYENQCI